MLDRNRQKQILATLAACYPNHSTDVIDVHSSADIANLHYLKEHELVSANLKVTIGGSFVFQDAKITAKGMDFLADDGGLSAILGTITIKLHADSIKELLNSRIASLDIPEEKRNWLKTQVNLLSGEALKAITKSLVEQGLSHIPDLFSWVQASMQK